MKMQIKNFDVINKHCPEAIDILKRYYHSEDGKGDIQISPIEIYAEDLLDAGNSLLRCMKIMINKATQENRDFNEPERAAYEAIKGWQIRFFEKYELEKPSNPLPKQTRTYIKDDYGIPIRPAMNSDSRELNQFEPLAKDQRMSDWCQKFVSSEDLSGLKLGDYVRSWVTGDHNDLTRRAMTTTGTGGVLIPTPLSASIIDLARNKARVMQAGAVVWPMDATTLTVPRQTGDASGAWRPELGKIHRTDVALEPVVLKSCSFGALVTLSMELMEDAIGLDVFLTQTLSNIIAEGVDLAALSGEGATDSESNERIEPVGVLNTLGVQEIDLNAALTSYAPFSQAVTMIRQVNGEPGGLMMAPVNFGILDALTASDGQPLMPPPSWGQISHYDTNQVDESTAIVGNWSQLAIGIRHNIRLEYAYTGNIAAQAPQKEVDLFSQNAVAIRVLWRGDVAVQRPDQFVKVINMNPDAYSVKAEQGARNKSKAA
ncbi:phage major capsid protein [Endozoicomonas sp. 4G]|uniref:phage major capsid protein n=1 Tax=Endozoicomonas sp. 4G TaxID=2872754 RepID=UPI002079096E|nr:phage major capsid protein [Endozoicomonas sp. 4G]